jgi:cytochrome c-type biogenesis protein CcmH/NrfG
LAEKQRVSESVKKSYLDTLGTAQLCLGHYEEAETAFRMGLKIDGDAMDLNIGLAETLVGRVSLKAAQQASTTSRDCLKHRARSAEASQHSSRATRSVEMTP